MFIGLFLEISKEFERKERLIENLVLGLIDFKRARGKRQRKDKGK